MKRTQEKSAQGKSAPKKNVQKKTASRKMSILPFVMCLLFFLGIAAGSYLTANAEMFFDAQKKENATASLPEELPEGGVQDTDILPEAGVENLQDTETGVDEAETPSVPDNSKIEDVTDAEETKSIQMGEDIFYTLFEDGTLWVSGSGYTWSFPDSISMTDFIAEQFDGKRADAKAEWFHAVTRIVISNEVTAIENCALSMYTRVKEVVYNGKMEFIDENAFKNCGIGTEEEVLWDMDLTDTKVFPGAFNGCLNPPVEYEETFIPE